MKTLIAALLRWIAAILAPSKDKPVDIVGTIAEIAHLSPPSQSLIKAAVSLGKSDGPSFMAAFHAHDWKTVAIDVVKAELTLAAAVPGPQQAAAALALQLLPLGVAFITYAAAHGHNSGEGGIGAAPEGNASVTVA